jgi:hypothetical protein
MRQTVTSFAILFTFVFLTGCVRPATRTFWSPIDSAVNAETTQTAVSSSNATSTEVPAPSGAKPSTGTPSLIKTSTPVVQLPVVDWNQVPKTLPDSTKGYELYSWQTGNDWVFTLITGTNRMKTFDEIISPNLLYGESGFFMISVIGMDEIEKLMERLPANEDVLWGGMDLSDQVPTGTIYLTFPPQKMMDELIDFCKKHSVKLISLKKP